MTIGIKIAVEATRYGGLGQLVSAFKTRVLSDGGTFEGEANLLNQSLVAINAAGFVYVPSAFKSGRLYSLKPTDGTGDLVFSRNSLAYRNNASNVLEQMAANVGRIHYVDGVPTLLNEPARTNLFLNSFAPVTQNITVVNGTVYTVSINGGTATLSGAGSGSATTGSNRTFTASGTTLTVTISGSPTWCQVEAGAFATSIIATLGSSVTRVADDTSLNNVDIIGQTEGTLYVETNFRPLSTARRLIAIGDGTTSNRIVLSCELDNTIACFVVAGGVLQTAIYTAVQTAGVKKIALTYTNNNIRLFINGTLAATDNSASIPLCSRLFISKSEFDSSLVNPDPLYTCRLYKTALTDTECINITT